MPYCSKCKIELPKGARYCPNCGRAVKVPLRAKPAPEVPPHLVEFPQRPTAITAAAILFFIFGIISIPVGLLTIALSGRAYLIGMKPSTLVDIGAIAIILGVPCFFAGYGLWKMLKWGAELGLVLCVISIFVDPIAASVVEPWTAVLGIVISLILIALIVSRWKSFRR